MSRFGSQLEERHRTALDAIEAERDLSLVISRLEDFSAKVANRLDGLDPAGMREIVRILVRRIEIDSDGIEVIFRVPPPNGPPRPTPTDETASWQHCTGVRRANFRLAGTMPKAREGLEKSQQQGARFPASRLHQAHVEKAMQSRVNSPDRLLVPQLGRAFATDFFCGAAKVRGIVQLSKDP